YNKGIVLDDLGRYSDAIKEYDIAISLDPNDPASHYNKGIVLDDLGRYSDAIKEYDIAINLNPNKFSYYSKKVRALCLKGDAKGAEANLDFLKRTFPNEPLGDIEKECMNLLSKPKTYNIPEDWVGVELYGYSIKKLIGVGGTSYVIIGEKNNVNGALKIYTVEVTTTTTQKSQTITALVSSSLTDMLRESARLQEISERSNYIVKLYGVFIDVNSMREAMMGDKKAYFTSPPTIVMEFMGGGLLKDILATGMVYSNYWRQLVILIALQVAYAIKAIHDEDFVHLDIKPQNVFFTDNLGKTALEALDRLKSGKVVARLGDLGSVRSRGKRVSQYTPEYCGVDQVEAIILGRGADPKMDIYALGSTIYAMLEGRALNPSEVVQMMNNAVNAYLSNGPFMNYLNKAKAYYASHYQGIKMSDKTFEGIVKRMVHPDPNQRPNINTVISWLQQLA
ncbi:tetratricopeptide repeat protein, partial [Acidianus sp. RZ1]|uniref:protein kinase domain-containing protein n=1 Tax=Acidianus sp. RZ1 TaxID=1540082 RepID=UPI001492ACC4